ncbi:carboxymuconolactone decarboxylase family protein [Psychrobacillus sp. FJAT-21963]|uniref:carboxymuconolactone decarboxylase family protein n=1 Tax=Psychrobacillus sp. FJAT-21963 TaxID=1712028 RepID=UPI00155F49CF
MPSAIHLQISIFLFCCTISYYIEAALNVGLSKEEIIELIMHCAGYAGFSKAVQAMG